ncbi:MAG TPA: hypothetical protein EYN89_13505, partial [Flavobacteriales bacterium]|nr:hypothetical protein [Flavobacteriales bacterium]
MKDQKNTIVSNNHMVVLLTMLLSGWVIFTDIYIYSKLGLILFTVITLLFLNGLGRKIPIKELIVLIMLMQMVVSPIIVFDYLYNKVHYPMVVGEQYYISYVFFCIVLFIIGLFLPLHRQKPNILKTISNINESAPFNGKFGVVLIIFGLLAGTIVDYVPGTFRFAVFLIENCKYIGAFYLFFSNNRYKYLWILVVYSMLTYTTIGGGLFINLFIWTFLFAIVAAFKYKVNLLVKTGFFIIGIFIAFFIQSFKTEYREVIWEGKGQAYSEQTRTNQEVFVEMATERALDTKSLYEYSNYSNFISRLNQGWILAKVLIHVPANEPFTNGEVFLSD